MEKSLSDFEKLKLTVCTAIMVWAIVWMKLLAPTDPNPLVGMVDRGPENTPAMVECSHPGAGMYEDTELLRPRI